MSQSRGQALDMRNWVQTTGEGHKQGLSIAMFPRRSRLFHTVYCPEPVLIQYSFNRCTCLTHQMKQLDHDLDNFVITKSLSIWKFEEIPIDTSKLFANIVSDRSDMGGARGDSGG